MMRLDEREAGVSRRQVVRALAAEGVDCFEGYCRPLYLQPLYQQDWPGKGEHKYGAGLCPVTERLFEREVFFHTALHPAIEPAMAERICVAFEKVWTHRETLRRLPDEGGPIVRRG
jgi:dTDP-4-amino-4,6-dideoxygalactose transaminase